MKQLKTIKISSNGKSEEIKLKQVSPLGKVIGLMFHSKNSEALLFSFDKPTKMAIHSYFVFFPFLAIWLDDKNKVIKKEIVKPFKISISPDKEFSKLIEIPINDKYSQVINSFLKLPRA